MEIGLWPSADPLDSKAAAWAYRAFSNGGVECSPDPRTEQFLTGLPGCYKTVDVRNGVRPKAYLPQRTVPVRAWVLGGCFVLLEFEAEAADALPYVRDLAIACGIVGYAPGFEVTLVGTQDWAVLQERWSEAEKRDAAYWRDEQSVPTMYDRLKWHVEAETFPPSIAPEQGFVHIGMYLTWIVLRDLYDPEGLPRKAIDEIKARHVTGCSLQKRLGGNLGRERFSLEGAMFTDSYYRGEGGYLDDYADVFGAAADNYSVPDSWETYSRIEPLISRRFAEWKERIAAVDEVDR